MPLLLKILLCSTKVKLFYERLGDLIGEQAAIETVTAALGRK